MAQTDKQHKGKIEFGDFLRMFRAELLDLREVAPCWSLGRACQHLVCSWGACARQLAGVHLSGTACTAPARGPSTNACHGLFQHTLHLMGLLPRLSPRS